MRLIRGGSESRKHSVVRDDLRHTLEFVHRGHRLLGDDRVVKDNPVAALAKLSIVDGPVSTVL